jgi:hypothetical protein
LRAGAFRQGRRCVRAIPSEPAKPRSPPPQRRRRLCPSATRRRMVPAVPHTQAKQDLDQVKELAGTAVRNISSMASKFMQDLGKY